MATRREAAVEAAVASIPEMIAGELVAEIGLTSLRRQRCTERLLMAAEPNGADLLFGLAPQWRRTEISRPAPWRRPARRATEPHAFRLPIGGPEAR